MFDLCYPTNTLCHLAKYKVKKTSNAKHRQKRERKNGTTNQSKPARGIYTGNAFFIRDTRHVGTIVGFVKVNCTLHVEWPLGEGGESNERNPDPFVSDCLPQCIVERTSLGQRAATLALRDPRYRANPASAQIQKRQRTRAQWALGYLVFSQETRSGVTNEGGRGFVLYFNAVSSSTSLIEMRTGWLRILRNRWCILEYVCFDRVF